MSFEPQGPGIEDGPEKVAPPLAVFEGTFWETPRECPGRKDGADRPNPDRRLRLCTPLLLLLRTEHSDWWEGEETAAVMTPGPGIYSEVGAGEPGENGVYV